MGLTTVQRYCAGCDNFPVGQKCALVRPLLKKPTLDPLDLNSYRPISNLTFVSKILERVINSMIADHADSFGLVSPVQSEFCLTWPISLC